MDAPKRPAAAQPAQPPAREVHTSDVCDLGRYGVSYDERHGGGSELRIELDDALGPRTLTINGSIEIASFFRLIDSVRRKKKPPRVKSLVPPPRRRPQPKAPQGAGIKVAQPPQEPGSG